MILRNCSQQSHNASVCVRVCNHIKSYQAQSHRCIYTLSVLQKLGNMTPEMTVSPLYIRISCELTFKHSHYIFNSQILDKINLGTIIFHKYALFTRHKCTLFCKHGYSAACDTLINIKLGFQNFIIRKIHTGLFECVYLMLILI